MAGYIQEYMEYFRQLVSGGIGLQTQDNLNIKSRYPLHLSQIHSLQTEDNRIYLILCFSFAKNKD